MVRISGELIRKKAEHHDGLMADLEELSLHQLEIERIEVVGTQCRKLQILYLQNNIIGRMENLFHLKELRYLNLALNNITRIEGLRSCEFLRKLDLTVNFIALEELEASVEHLSTLQHLRELFLLGNPAAEWPGYRAMVAASLPLLEQLDGKEISRSERIQAQQELPSLLITLRRLAEEKGANITSSRGTTQAGQASAIGADSQTAGNGSSSSGDGAEPWNPETRARMYREISEKKEEDARRKRENLPEWRAVEDLQAEGVAAAREAEAEARAAACSVNGDATATQAPLPAPAVKQCNQGRWEFSIEEEDGHGSVVLSLGLNRFLDLSLIDVDVHPTYVSVVVKGKVFRLLWPAEVKADQSKCQRSQTTGELCITVPKVNPGSDVLRQARLREKDALQQRGGLRTTGVRGATATDKDTGQGELGGKGGSQLLRGRTGGGRNFKLAEEMLRASEELCAAPVPAPSLSALGDEDSEVPPLERVGLTRPDVPRE